MTLKTPSFLPFATATLLLGGCSLGPVSTGSMAYQGWSGARIQATTPAAEAVGAAVTRIHTEGICHVQAPNINPVSAQKDRIAPFGPRTSSPEKPVSGGIVVKESICSDTIDPELVLEVAYRLRERGYSVPFGSSSSTEVVERTFESFKRDNGFYGSGFTLDALSYLGVDPMEWVQPTVSAVQSTQIAIGWAEAGR